MTPATPPSSPSVLKCFDSISSYHPQNEWEGVSRPRTAKENTGNDEISDAAHVAETEDKETYMKK